MTLATVSGDLSGGLYQCPRISVSTVSGDLQLPSSQSPRESTRSRAPQATSTCASPAAPGMAVRVATPLGRCSNDLPLSREDARGDPGPQRKRWHPLVGEGLGAHWAQVLGVLNARDGSLTVKTISGDISLRGVD